MRRLFSISIYFIWARRGYGHNTVSLRDEHAEMVRIIVSFSFNAIPQSSYTIIKYERNVILSLGVKMLIKIVIATWFHWSMSLVSIFVEEV